MGDGRGRLFDVEQPFCAVRRCALVDRDFEPSLILVLNRILWLRRQVLAKVIIERVFGRRGATGEENRDGRRADRQPP